MRCLAVAAALTLVGARLLAQHDMASMRASDDAWTLAFDASVNALYDHQFTKRGDRQIALLDWEMLMATHRLGPGTLELRGMTSVEPWTLGGSGYAELLQTGGSYRGAFLHDRQHPHDAVMELAARYSVRPLSLYVAAVGEPALGPVSYMHRASGERDPFAPLGHHWQDASHQSFGVVTLGVHGRGLALEGSAFNAREADDKHLVVDYRGAALDSYSGRVRWTPAPSFATTAWLGYLVAHDRLNPDSRMHRYGASAEYDRELGEHRRWATTAIWGMNVHHHGAASHELAHAEPGASPHHHASSMLLESSLDVTAGRTVFGRLERVMKNGEELGFLGGDLTELYDIRSVSAGATQLLFAGVSFGVRGSVNVVPASLQATYGTRTPSGVAIFLQARPPRRSAP